MVKPEKTALKKGAWSAEEDRKLINYIKRYKIWNWSEMSKAAGLARSGKSCRLRWVNYLRPDIKHGNFSNEEVNTIMSLHETLGNRWATIASKLPGRTDNEVKNFWHTHLKKRKNKPNPNSSTSFVPKDEIELLVSPKSTSESDQLLFFPEPKQEPPKLEACTSENVNIIDIESPQAMSTEDLPSNNCEISQEQYQQNDNDKSIISITNIFGQPQSSLAQQQQETVSNCGEMLNGSLATFFEPDSLVGPSIDEVMWPHESMWMYESSYEDVCNDWLDYMDPIF